MSKRIERQPQFAVNPLALAIALAVGSALAPSQARAELPTGGVVLPGNGAATFANPNATTLNINQTSKKAIIDWQSFNISAGNTVNFKQPDVTSATLNRIHQADASRIAGALNANGRVYLVNQNGIIFNGTAQINTGSLLASSLDIDENLFKNSSIYAAILAGKPALQSTKTDGDPGDITIEHGAEIKTANNGSVLIFAPNITNDGKIETPDGQTVLAAAKDKVYLMVSDRDDDYRGVVVEVGIGGKVTNANLGEIIAERGNITLMGLAVNQNGRIRATTAVDLNGTVRLLARDSATVVTNSTKEDQSFRGFDVKGENPSSDTVAYAVANRSGSVTLGENSRIEITPDTNGKTATNDQVQNPSKVEIMGKTVVMQKNSAIVAPAGEVIVTATSKPNVSFENAASDGIEGDQYADDQTRIFLDQGSTIDVSGVDTELDMSRNALEVELRGNELKDSPLQRHGILYGKKVTVDLRNGDTIPIADISAAVAAIKRDINERSVNGGSIKLNSYGDVQQAQGSVLDVSGGSIHYRAGYIDSTKLVSDGVVYDISTADPNRHYNAIVGLNSHYYAKWNLTRTYIGMNTQQRGEWVPAYTQGYSAGGVAIDSHRLLLEGDLRANVVDGFYQRDIANSAQGGSLDILLRRGLDSAQQVHIVDNMVYHDLTADDRLVDVSDETAETTPNAGKPVLIDEDGDGKGDMLLSTGMIASSGLQKLTVAARDVDIAAGAQLQLRDGASLSLSGHSVVNRGTITTHGGTVKLDSSRDSNFKDNPDYFARYDLTLAAGSRIDVSGRFTNDYLLGADAVPTDTISTNAGSVALKATGNLTLEAGSSIDANGGAYVTQKGKLVAGKGGDISLTTAVEGGAALKMDGTLSSYAIAQGGKLSIAAPSIRIAETPAATSGDSGAEASAPPVLQLNNAFFQQGGFSSYNLTANMQSMQVDGSANLQLTPHNFVVLDDTYLKQPSGSDIAAFAPIGILPAWLQQPMSLGLTLKQTQAPVMNASSLAEPKPGSFSVDTGAVITTNPGGSIALASDNSLYIDGSLQADGGHISAVITAHKDIGTEQRYFDPAQSLWLGRHAQLRSNATWVDGRPDPNGLRTGTMHDAGTVHLQADRGFIAIEQRDDGAPSIDASGLLQPYDAQVTAGNQSTVQTLTAQGAAGSVELAAAEGILLDGEIRLARASASAAGGRLSVFIKENRIADGVYGFSYPQLTPVIRIDGKRDASIIGGLHFGDAIANDDARLDTVSLDSTRLNNMDLDVLTLNNGVRKIVTDSSDNHKYVYGRLEFANGAALHTTREINLVSADLRVDDNSLNTVASATVWAGIDESTDYLGFNISEKNLLQPLAAASPGRGSLVLRGSLIDLVGNISVDNVGELSLVSSGDIRLRSNSHAVYIVDTPTYGGFESDSLTTAANINLLAQQVYPNTLADYSIVSTLAGGKITIAHADGDALAPLSAGGRLDIVADTIEQGGVLRAPLGEIDLGNEQTSQLTLLPGSETSVSAAGQQIPLGSIQGKDLVWSYRTRIANSTGGADPHDMFIDRSTFAQKSVALKADKVDLQQNAVVDLAGGGDIYATEFVPGPGGSTDVLDGVNAGRSFAIIPLRGAAYAPFDAQESYGGHVAAGQTLKLAQAVTLQNGRTLAAGEYTMLPARYALQPDAVLVTPAQVKGQIAPGADMARIDGAPIAAAKTGYANTSLSDANWSAYVFEPGAVARTRSEYNYQTASAFFTGDKALYTMPADAAQMQIAAGSALNLKATLKSDHADGSRGSRVDIVADHLQVAPTQDTTAEPGVVVISADDLSALKADSVLLGGTRSSAAAADGTLLTRIDARAADITVQENTQLQGKELIFAAANSIRIGDHAVIHAAADHTDSNSDSFAIDGDGALLQVSGLRAATLVRGNEASATGDLLLGQNASLQAGASVLLDASHTMTISNAAIDTPRLTISSARISLGDAADPSSVSGTVLDTALLTQLQARHPDSIALLSRSALDLLSDISLGSNNLTLQAGNINANGHAAQFAATNQLNLQGTASAETAAGGGGSLAFMAPILQLGDGTRQPVANAQLVLDAKDVSLTAANGLLLHDALNVQGSGDINIATPQITAVNAAQTTLVAQGNIAVTTPDGSVVGDSAVQKFLQMLSAIGSSLQLTANSIALDSTLVLPSAQVQLHARNGDITVGREGGNSAKLQLAGVTQQFGDQQRASAGGVLELHADNGNIVVHNGSSINISGATLTQTVTEIQTDSNGNKVAQPVIRTAGGSAAGAIVIDAAHGNAQLDGVMTASAVNAGQGGSITVDAKQIQIGGTTDVHADDALFTALRAGQFDHSIEIRKRSGDITVSNVPDSVSVQAAIKAQQIHLIADSGSVSVDGKLDATGDKGGNIAIDAGQNATLTSNALLDAHALASDGRGGSVSVSAGSTVEEGKLDLQTGSAINVQGGDDSASNQGINTVRQGEVHLRARRNADNSMNIIALNASVTGADRVELEAFDDKSIRASTIDQSTLVTIKTNIDSFVASLNDDVIASLGSMATAANFHLLPGIEIRSDRDDGSITVVNGGDALDFSALRFVTGSAVVDGVRTDKVEPGVLTLRASGDLHINGSISDGFTVDGQEFGLVSPAKILTSDHSWAYRLVAGADIASAYLGSVVKAGGDFVLAADTTVRTGTGDILVAAGSDVVFAGATSALYTAGLTDNFNYLTPRNDFYDGLALWGPAVSLPYVGYLFPYELNGFFDAGAIPQRVAFGRSGGDITISAGKDVVMAKPQHLSSEWLQRFNGEIASTSDATVFYKINTTGIVATNFLQGVGTLGGGDITVRADGDITNLLASAPVTIRQNRDSDFSDKNSAPPVTGTIIARDANYFGAGDGAFWEQNGGGDISVSAGGNILSPQLLADHGKMTLHAGGNVAAADGGNAAMLSVTDTQVAIDAFRDITVGAIYNTTMMSPPMSSKENSAYFSYTDRARVDISSTAGSIDFRNSIDTSGYADSRFNAIQDLESFDKRLLKIMPGTVTAVAHSGDIVLEDSMSLFPEQKGQLELLARNNIVVAKAGGSEVNLNISDADFEGSGERVLPSLLAQASSDKVRRPRSEEDMSFYARFFGSNKLTQGEDPSSFDRQPEKHASTPVHQGDTTAALIIAATGDIDGNRQLVVSSAKQLRAYAGKDIRDIVFDLQNVNASDNSELRAAHDIDLGYNLNPATGTIRSNAMGITIAGPGRLDVIAGDDLVLGSSKGIVSFGNQHNTHLIDGGADIMAMAGAASMDTAAVRSYLDRLGPNSDATLIEQAEAALSNLFAAGKGSDLSLTVDIGTPSAPQLQKVAFNSVADVQSTFAALTTAQQLRLALAVLKSGKLQARDANVAGVDNRDYTPALLDFVFSSRFAGDALQAAKLATGQQFTSYEQMLEFFAGRSGRQNNADAKLMFAQLADINQRGLLFDIVNSEVLKGGVESLNKSVQDAQTQGTQRGYNAIETLFPDIDQNSAARASAAADISMAFSTMSTRDGGDINFMTPRGGINVGLANNFAGLNKKPSDLGLIVQGTGSIHGISYDSIDINSSRIFALDGGDILLWSSQHDIDAGRGAKTALSIPPPRTVYDSTTGEPIGQELPAAVSGSGIQAAIYTPGRAPGSVYLFAPQGVIDAGDAGISSAGDLFLAASRILGADNIKFGGVAIGVPTTTGISANLTNVSTSASTSTASATNDVTNKSSGDCSDPEGCNQNSGVAFVTVEIIGLGD